MTRSDVRAFGAAVFLSAAGCTGGPKPVPSYWDPGRLPDEWRTRAERTNYQETGRYDEVVDFCRRLAAASPYAHYTTFGTSGEGRPLPLLIVSKRRAFTPEAARRAGKLRVLVQNCIHAGECEGKDASLALARDILISGSRADLLNEVDLLIIPIFNADGHERFGPASRINQNGPREMGWRVTAVNLNLNRDYMKADTVEMQAWLRCWVAWQPDFFFDNHTTDGSDCQYDLFYSTTLDGDADPHIQAWTRATLLPHILPKLAADGHVTLEQADPRDPRDLSKGIAATGAFVPRLSTGYSAICSRPTILVETHARKPYGQRVRATYNLMVRTLEELNQEPEKLRAAIQAADERGVAARGAGEDGHIALTRVPTDDSEPLVYRGVEQRLRHSDITGGDVLEYTDRPQDVATRLFNHTRVDKAVVPPAAYLVPPQWSDVIGRLEWHGIEFFRLPQPARLDVETYRFENAKFAERPYEGRQRPSYQTVAACQSREFPAGTAVVPLNQRHAKLIAHLLEPDAPDSLIAWGFFNAIFEQKEYTEAYVLEPIAQEMLLADPALKREFEEKLRTDEAFAKNPGARLDFFYRRSPYWDTAWNVYPVGRLMDEGVLAPLRPR